MPDVIAFESIASVTVSSDMGSVMTTKPKYQTLLIHHNMACELTRLTGGQVDLHRLGIFPVRCKGCGDLLQDEPPSIDAFTQRFAP